MGNANDKRLFWACFIALITTAFGFIIRALTMDQWGVEFNLSPTQKGEIFGVGLWPMAISIVLFSLIIDRIGYGPAMIFACLCHVASGIITICAPLVLAKEGASPDQVAAGYKAGYWMLYFGNLVVALGNGTVEAVINPVVATMFSREKTKWLNILHAGWPGGLVLGGVIVLLMGAQTDWRMKVALIFLPTVVYALMMLTCKFPPNERVTAGIPYKVMLQEVGILGAVVVVPLIVLELGRDFEVGLWFQLAIIAVLLLAYGIYVQALGRIMFFILLLIMIPLATTELGTDSWISDLMTPEMGKIGLQGGWVLVYTSFIMMVLRFCAGPIVHKISPLGLLAISAAIAAVGLFSLSISTGILILGAATLYGFGKTFFWPTMLGVASEQFPKGGALLLNTVGGTGMLAVGVIGTALLGNIQDKEMDKQLQDKNQDLYAKVIGPTKVSVFGEYRSLDQDKVKTISKDDQDLIKGIETTAKKDALKTVAIFPCIMLVGYLGLIFYFRARGGYQAEVLTGHKAEDKEFTGGVEGPAEL